MSKQASRNPWRTIVVVLTLAFLAAVVPLSSALASGNAADATNGQTLFQANCAACHKADASGGVKVGSATAPDVRWSAIGSDFKNDPALVQRAILQGLDESGQPLDAAMPRFATDNKLSSSQAADVVAYLQTLNPKLPKTGDPIGGQTLAVLVLAGGMLALGGLKLRQSLR